MEELGKANLLVTSIKSDTTRKGLLELGEILIQLSIKLGEAKESYVKNKAGYEREFIIKKEQRRQHLEEKYDQEYEKEKLTNPKAKREKITNVEVENNVNLEMINPQQEEEHYLDNMNEAKMIVDYLTPILVSYYEFINIIKFNDRQCGTTPYQPQ